MKRTLIPTSFWDRFNLLMGLFSAGGGVFAFVLEEFWAALGFAAMTLITLVSSYVFQDQAVHSAAADEYSTVIARIGAIGEQLSELSVFLEKERARIADTEATVRKLQDEKVKLEPVVSTQREAVEAILAAHAARTVKNAWKERFLGFSLGLVASFLAAIIHEYLK